MKTTQRVHRRISKRVQPSSPRRRISHNNSVKVARSIKGGAEHSAEREKNRTCIWCCEKIPVTQFTEEHIFPREIGGKLILKDRTCISCNGQYGGAADADLVKHVVIKLDRLVCQIKGMSGKRPNPFEHDHPVAKEPQPVDDELTDAGNAASRSVGRKSKKQGAENGGSGLRQGHTSATERLEEILQSIGHRSEIGKVNEEHQRQHRPEGIRSHPDIRALTTFDIVKYKKGILKIAYELACYWLGTSYLKDPIGQKIRQALKDQKDLNQWEGVTDLRWKIDLIATASTIPYWDNKPASHVAFLIPSHQGLTVYVRIFKAFEGILEISQTPERYRVEEGKFIEMDTKSDEMKQSTLFQQLASLPQ